MRIPRCPRCKQLATFSHTEESEPFKRPDGVVTRRTLIVYRCENPECTYDDDIKIPE